MANNAEDSDYYTPEDPQTTILSSLYKDDVRFYIIFKNNFNKIIFIVILHVINQLGLNYPYIHHSTFSFVLL